MLQLLALLIVPFLAPEPPPECDALPRPKEFIEFEAKSNWVARVERGEFSIVETIAIAPKKLSERVLSGFADTPSTVVTFFNDPEELEDLIGWAIKQGWVAFDWRQKGIQFANSSAQSCGFAWIQRHEYAAAGIADGNPMKTSERSQPPLQAESVLFPILRLELSKKREGSHSRIDLEKRLCAIFDADRIYSETWAARWFSDGSQIKLETPTPGPRRSPLYFDHRSPSEIDRIGGALILAEG